MPTAQLARIEADRSRTTGQLRIGSMLTMNKRLKRRLDVIRCH